MGICSADEVEGMLGVDVDVVLGEADKSRA